MNIGVAYASPSQRVWLQVEVPDGCSLREAIEASGILDKFPELHLDDAAVGIFGKRSKLEARLRDGDRVEIYRPITVDPDTVERRDQ